MQLLSGAFKGSHYHSLLRNKRLLRTTIVSLFAVILLLLLSVSTYAATGGRSHVNAPANTAVLNYKMDTMRTGQNPNETILNTSTVNATQFGKRVSYPVDGQVLAEPLFMPNLTINGNVHNVVFVATEHDSVYAFDADQKTPVAPLWQRSFLNVAKGITTVPSSAVNCTDITPEYGITSTPVIDPNTGTLYVMANTSENGHNVYRLHALNITTGLDKTGSPIVISASIKGTGDGNVNGVVTFDPVHQLERGALLLLNGVIYTTWGSHCDNNPYHGWIISYNATTFKRAGTYNDTRNGYQAGIWSSGAGLSADSSGNLYFMDGNGKFDANTGGLDYGDSIVKLTTSGGLKIATSFTPFNQTCLDTGDVDLGSGGALLLPTSNELIGVGKEGRIYVVNRDAMGGYNTIANPCSNQGRTDVDKILQESPPATVNGGVWNTPAYWNGSAGEYVYTIGSSDHIKAWKLTNGLLSTSPTSQSSESFNFPAGNLVVSSNGTTPGTGIVWTITSDHFLRAYDATNLANELFTGSLPGYTKFSVPTVTNGEVFVGSSSSLEIYGLLN